MALAANNVFKTLKLLFHFFALFSYVVRESLFLPIHELILINY